MIDRRRKLIRVNAGDFLEIRLLNEVGVCHKCKSKDFTLMGLCFSSQADWQIGQVLAIKYFIPDELEAVGLKMVVAWSELIDAKAGYFCGGEIIEIEKDKQEKFTNYYFRKLKENFST